MNLSHIQFHRNEKEAMNKPMSALGQVLFAGLKADHERYVAEQDPRMREPVKLQFNRPKYTRTLKAVEHDIRHELLKEALIADGTWDSYRQQKLIDNHEWLHGWKRNTPTR